MPLTKQYLKYESHTSFGVVVGRKGNALLWPGKDRVYVISPCLQSLVIWDPRTSLKFGRLSCDSEVSALCLSPDSSQLVVGCEDGNIHLYHLQELRLMLKLSGHKSAVTCLAYNEDGTRVVSGSKDNQVIIWDMISETGLYRLKGHKGQITDCKIIPGYDVLITSSKDGLVKVWDLDTQHCFQTLAQHRTEVWSIEVINDILITGSTKLSYFILSQADENKLPLSIADGGTLKTFSQEKVIKIKGMGNYLVILFADSTVEVFYLFTQEEVEKKLKKAARRAASKGVELKTIPSRGKSVCCMKCKSKAGSVDVLSHCEQLWVLVVLQTNDIEVYLVSGAELKLTHSIRSPGHRTDVRTVSFSSDDSQILTASAEEVKVWNRGSLQCVCTLTSGYCLCSTFVPGNRHAIVGTKAGSVQVFDLSRSCCVADITDAHSGPVWSVTLSPDKRGVVTGSADQSIKFWDFEISGPQNLSLTHFRTLQMSEDVLCVRYSPDGRLLAVALIDTTVKVFFADSLKFFLSLYGHKLPVLSMDISSDSTLLASCSADKNIRIWGLDFGDCHKSLFAHDSSIMAVQFFPNTHQLISASKDRLLKRWDADNFKHIQTLEGHCAEIWCLAVSSDGALVVSGSHDHSLHVWKKTQEPLVLSEQEEMEREKVMEGFSMVDSQNRVVPGEEVDGEVSLPGAPVKETMTTADRLMDALSLWEAERDKWVLHEQECKEQAKQLPSPARHPILVAMGNIKAEKYVLNILKSVRSSELDESLLVLPFHQASLLLELTNFWLKADWEVELVCRCLFFLLRVHHNQLVGMPTLLPLVADLRSRVCMAISQYKDVLGLNLAGLHFLKDEMARNGSDVFGDVQDLVRKKPRHY